MFLSESTLNNAINRAITNYVNSLIIESRGDYDDGFDSDVDAAEWLVNNHPDFASFSPFKGSSGILLLTNGRFLWVQSHDDIWYSFHIRLNGAIRVSPITHSIEIFELPTEEQYKKLNYAVSFLKGGCKKLSLFQLNIDCVDYNIARKILEEVNYYDRKIGGLISSIDNKLDLELTSIYNKTKRIYDACYPIYGDSDFRAIINRYLNSNSELKVIDKEFKKIKPLLNYIVKAEDRRNEFPNDISNFAKSCLGHYKNNILYIDIVSQALKKALNKCRIYINKNNSINDIAKLLFDEFEAEIFGICKDDYFVDLCDMFTSSEEKKTYDMIKELVVNRLNK